MKHWVCILLVIAVLAPASTRAAELIDANQAPVTDQVDMYVSVGSDEVMITLGLFGGLATRTVNNFMHICSPGIEYQGKIKSYVGSPFHRIIPNFMVQGGDITNGNGTGGYSRWGPKFEDEAFQVAHSGPGVLSMANAGPDTNSSQFFITTVSTAWLNYKHVVFGRVLNDIKNVTKLESHSSESHSSESHSSEPPKIVRCVTHEGKTAPMPAEAA